VGWGGGGEASKKGGKARDLACRQGQNSEAQILTPLAWHEAFQLASAVERTFLSSPVQPRLPTRLPACLPALLVIILQREEQQESTYTRNWSGDRLSFFVTFCCSGSFPCSKFGLARRFQFVFISPSLSRPGGAVALWFLFSFISFLFFSFRVQVRGKKEKREIKGMRNTVPPETPFIKIQPSIKRPSPDSPTREKLFMSNHITRQACSLRSKEEHSSAPS